MVEEAENLAMQLMMRMMADGCSQEDINKVSSDKSYREEMYKKYNLK